MRNRFLALTGLWLCVTAGVFLTERPIDGQERRSPTKADRTMPPRTPDGRPDLQGVWDFATLTPLQRPAEFAGKLFLTDADVEKLQRRAETRNDENAPAPPPNGGFSDGQNGGNIPGYNQFWMDATSVVTDRRTSLIVDPPDGRIPALTDHGKQRAAANKAQLDRPPAGPEDRSTSERCLLGLNAGPPVIPKGYNQHVQLVQTPGYVIIHNEMVHHARVVPLDGRPHLPEDMRTWLGDSIGHWEGDTLVVETRNFKGNVWNQFSGWNMGSDEQLRVTERFTRVDADTLRYEFTVDDPTIWTRPWTAVVPMRNSGEPMYEYACHEGNYGMGGILRGARADEAAAADTAKKDTAKK